MSPPSIDELTKNIVVVPITRKNEFTRKIIDFLGLDQKVEEYMKPETFSGGEFCPRFLKSIKGKKVFIVAPHTQKITPQDWAMRVQLVSDAAKIAGSESNILVAPDLPYSRQDRSPRNDMKLSGQPFSALVLARALHASGIDQVLTMHVHNEKVRDLYAEVWGKPKDELVFNLDPAPLIAHYLLSQESSLEIADEGRNIVFVGPDKGAMPFVIEVMRWMNLPNAAHIYCKKNRGRPNDKDKVFITIEHTSDNFEGFDGKIVITLDDIADTCGTIEKTNQDIFVNGDQGRPKGTIYYFTHPVLAGRDYETAFDTLEGLDAQEIIFTNTHPFVEHRRTENIKRNSTVLRCAAYFADAIVNCIEQGRTPTEVYGSLKGQLQELNGMYEYVRSTLHFLRKAEVLRRVRVR